MLSFFRINDPYRLIGLIIILFLVRIPFLIEPEYIFVPELKWMLLGEKIAQGNLLYKEVWDTTGPFSALFYTLVHAIFGKSIIAYRVISFVIVIFYCLYYSRVLINNNIYLEKTYVPAVIFGILSSLFFDLFTLSPPLLGLFFILVSLNYLFELLEKGLQDNQYYNIGFLIGLASLFYLPYATYLAFVIFCMFLFSNTSLRRYLLTALGFLFPFLIAVIFYSLYHGLDSFLYMFLVSFLTVKKQLYVGLENQVMLIAIPLLVFVLALGKIFSAARFINFQQKTQQVMVFYLIVSALSYFLIIDVSPMHLYLAIPGLTFFATHYFLLIRKKLISEIAFTLFTLSIPLLTLGIYFGIVKTSLIDFNNLMVSLDAKKEEKTGRIVVLGNDFSPFLNSSLATPYLNWNLASKQFQRLKYYEVVIAVSRNFKKDLPQLIIDQSNSVKTLFEQVPSLANQYERCGENRYCLKPLKVR